MMLHLYLSFDPRLTDLCFSKKPKVLVFNQQSLRDSIGLIKTLYAGITKAGVKFDHVIFCTNITYKNRRFKVGTLFLPTCN